ncbi:MAG TPA: hypothetical protein VL221_06190 [Bacteroidota bacterium]|nr:hypothetical protein [Bacteroidota bacterium]
MNTLTHTRWLALLLAVLLIVLAPAYAQKKKSSPGASSTPAAEQHAQPKAPATIRDIIVSLQGQQTNLGTLTKVTGDYVVFESEGDTLMYPLGSLQVVKFLKTEEGEARKIEIRFLSKD